MDVAKPTLATTNRAAAGGSDGEPDRKGRSFLIVNPERQFDLVRGLSSPVRIRILRLLRKKIILVPAFHNS